MIRTFDSQTGESLYTFDGTDANGNQERRGLTTKVETRAATGGTLHTTTGAYDQAGSLIIEKLPAGIVRRANLDRVGKLVSLTYSGKVGASNDQPWFGWSSMTNAQGQIVAEATPTSGGNAYSGSGVTAIATSLAYSYDKAGRLTGVTDKNGNVSGGVFTATACETRSYVFDVNGNRTSQTTRTSSTGTCPTTGGTTISRAYDTYDRPTTGGNGTGTYVYDALGRQTTVPGVDAPNSAGGNLTLGYYHSDAAASIKQGTLEHQFTLDGAGRRLLQTTKNGSTTTETLEHHYTDESDNPAWSIQTPTGQPAVLTKYLETLAGDLSLTITGGGNAELALATPRGDIAATVVIPSSGSATGINSWSSYTEYGQPKQTVTKTPGTVSGVGYGWLGAKQRATTDIGLTLMGARLYNLSTGLFTSLDSQYQGGDTWYGYPSDPINKTDLNGTSWGAVANALGVISDIAAFIPGPIGIVASAVTGYASAGIYRAIGDSRRAHERFVNTTIGLFVGGVGKLAARGIGRATTRLFADYQHVRNVATSGSRYATNARGKPTVARGPSVGRIRAGLIGGRRLNSQGRQAIAASWVRQASYGAAFSGAKYYAHKRYWNRR